MDRIILQSRTGSDGTLHFELPLGPEAADTDVRITVERIGSGHGELPRTMTAADLLKSGLVGMWADRTDIGDSQSFARRLREEAQVPRR